MREAAIAEVGLDDEGRMFVRPTKGSFEHVYRAAMGVYWDEPSRRLSHSQPPKDWTPVQWFQQIVAAVADEYGVLLKPTFQTTWADVPNELRSAIESAAHANVR